MRSQWTIRKIVKLLWDIIKHCSSGFTPNGAYSRIVRSKKTYTSEFLTLLLYSKLNYYYLISPFIRETVSLVFVR
jgi:hypothetical protein